MKALSHERLLRQLTEAGLDQASLPNREQWCLFLERVASEYQNADRERDAFERSQKRSAEELSTVHEQTSATSRALLHKERDKLKLILSALGEGVILLNDQQHIEFLNPAGEKLLGAKFEQIAHRRFERVFGVPGWEGALRQLLGDREEKTIESRFMRDDGSIFPASIKCVPLRAGDGKYLGCVLTFEDITRQKEVEGALQDERAAAVIASKHKSDYLAEMSHEIRTPLNSILSLVQLLSYAELEEEQRDDLQTLESCVHALRQILNDVLDLSKIEAGKLMLNKQPFSLRGSVDTVMAQFRGAFREKALDVALEFADQIPERLYGDSARIEQVLINLISNAVKFTPARGRISVRVQLLATTHNSVEISLQVQDSGPGIPPDKQARLFRAFDQGDAAVFGEHGGTGLGLFICARLTALMNGRLSLTSELGKGTSFSVKLPLSFAKRSASAAEDSAELAGAPALSRVRVLLVEDNEINKNSISRLLGHHGYVVSMAENGAVALQRLEEESFDVVLMDLHMPKMDGLEATRRIRSGEVPGSAVPIVALTAHAVQGVAESCYAAGMNGFITKPIDYGQLFRTVESLVASHPGVHGKAAEDSSKAEEGSTS